MRKFATALVVLVLAAFMAGCGNSSKSATTDYTLPTANTSPPANGLMGGSIQGKPLALNNSVTLFAGDATGFTAGSADGSSSDARFYQPTGITTNGTNFYVTDYLNNLVRQIDANGTVTTLTDASGIRMTFNRPTDITTDGTNLFVVESGSNVIRKIEISSKTVTTIGSSTGAAGSVDSTVMADARFNQPVGITTDGKNLFVTDIGNETIRWIEISTGAVHTLAGSSGKAGFDDGIGPNARFNLPARLTTNGSALYVTDLNNRTIRKIVISTAEVSTIAGKADTAPSIDDANSAVGTDARFNQPNGITTDGTNLYITDSYNNTIRKVSLSAPHAVEKVAGITYDSSQGLHPALFYTPIGITTDGKNLIFIDSIKNVIRKIQ